MRKLVTFIGVFLLLGIAGACTAPATTTGAPAPTPAAVSGIPDPLPVKLGYSAKPVPTGVTRVYDLVVKQAPWELAPGVVTQAVTYNGSVPGPAIRVKEGETLRVRVKNDLSQDTSIHWHGLHVPNAMDGVPGVTQTPIRPGETFTYEFTASHSGTFMYHPHINSVEQIDNGLYGLLVIEPQQPDVPAFDKEFSMMMGAWTLGAQAMSGQMGGMNMNYNYFTINGKAYPATEPWTVKLGDKVRVRIVNISNLPHPMHLHGMDFKVVAKDGEPVAPANRQWMNTLTVNPGETYDIAFIADNPGNWAFHCHELHHTENDGVEPGGLIQLIRYEGASTLPAGQTSPTPMPQRMPGMGH